MAPSPVLLMQMFYDKNLASVEIKNGKIKVNGQTITLTTALGIPSYSLLQPTVDPNTSYTFEIVFPDGKSYTGSVTTQGKTFTSLNVPANSNINSDLTISWQDVYKHDELTISLKLTTATGTVSGKSFSLSQNEMMAGSFVIPKSSFATPSGITSVMVILTGIKMGTIDSKFRNGSQVVSRMWAEKSVAFN